MNRYEILKCANFHCRCHISQAFHWQIQYQPPRSIVSSNNSCRTFAMSSSICRARLTFRGFQIGLLSRCPISIRDNMRSFLPPLFWTRWVVELSINTRRYSHLSTEHVKEFNYRFLKSSSATMKFFLWLLTFSPSSLADGKKLSRSHSVDNFHSFPDDEPFSEREKHSQRWSECHQNSHRAWQQSQSGE